MKNQQSLNSELADSFHVINFFYQSQKVVVLSNLIKSHMIIIKKAQQVRCYVLASTSYLFFLAGSGNITSPTKDTPVPSEEVAWLYVSASCPSSLSHVILSLTHVYHYYYYYNPHTTASAIVIKYTPL